MPVIIIRWVPDPEEVRQQHLLAVQGKHLSLGAPVPQHTDGEEDSCINSTIISITLKASDQVSTGITTAKARPCLHEGVREV